MVLSKTMGVDLFNQNWAKLAISVNRAYDSIAKGSTRKLDQEIDTIGYNCHCIGNMQEDSKELGRLLSSRISEQDSVLFFSNIFESLDLLFRIQDVIQNVGKSSETQLQNLDSLQKVIHKITDLVVLALESFDRNARLQILNIIDDTSKFPQSHKIQMALEDSGANNIDDDMDQRGFPGTAIAQLFHEVMQEATDPDSNVILFRPPQE